MNAQPIRKMKHRTLRATRCLVHDLNGKLAKVPEIKLSAFHITGTRSRVSTLTVTPEAAVISPYPKMCRKFSANTYILGLTNDLYSAFANLPKTSIRLAFIFVEISVVFIKN